MASHRCLRSVVWVRRQVMLAVITQQIRDSAVAGLRCMTLHVDTERVAIVCIGVLEAGVQPTPWLCLCIRGPLVGEFGRAGC